jgi:hypothetical protein
MGIDVERAWQFATPIPFEERNCIPPLKTCHPERSAAKSKDLHSAGSAKNVPRIHKTVIEHRIAFPFTNNLSFRPERSEVEKPAFPSSPPNPVILSKAKDLNRLSPATDVGLFRPMILQPPTAKPTKDLEQNHDNEDN